MRAVVAAGVVVMVGGMMHGGLIGKVPCLEKAEGQQIWTDCKVLDQRLDPAVVGLAPTQSSAVGRRSGPEIVQGFFETATGWASV